MRVSRMSARGASLPPDDALAAAAIRGLAAFNYPQFPFWSEQRHLNKT